jgi:4-hydroxybenzoate polyprenyltransferase
VKALAFGRLLRLSLAPSAAADVAAGLTLGAGGHFPGGSASWLLIGASLCVYTGNLALNDWADREHDARTRAERPIPSGRVSSGGALGLALGLQGAAVLLAALASLRTGAWVAGIALAASFYNLRGRGPWLGPLLLGLCRAGNLGAGVLLAAGGLRSGHVVVCGLYGAYVFLASRLGRMEDAEDAGPLGRARLYIAGAGACLMALPLAGALHLAGLNADVGLRVAYALGLLAGGELLARAAFGRLDSRADVERNMGVLLRRLLVFAAIVAMMSVTYSSDALPPGPSGEAVALLILAGYPLSWMLRKVFPPS